MDIKIENLKEEVNFTDNSDKLEKLKKSYLILKQKVCRSHDLIKLYNDKLKECDRVKIDLDLANKETKKMTSNYNGALAKVIKLELQNTEYKKNIESLSNTIAMHETKMAGDRQHLQQLICKMKDLEEKHMDKLMQLDLEKSLLQDKVKELECQLKISNKNCNSIKKINKRQQNIESNDKFHLEKTVSTVNVAVNTISATIATIDVAVNTSNAMSTVDTAMNTVSSMASTVDVAVNTIERDIKLDTLIEKSVMTDISCNLDKDDLYPLFCNECESILSDPYDKICRSMIKYPQLIEIIPSPVKSLHTVPLSTSSIEGDDNLANCHANHEICSTELPLQDINIHNNNLNSTIVPLKPELSVEGNHIIKNKPFDLVAHQSLSNQPNGLSNVVPTPCLINESNNLNNLTSTLIEKLEEKVKRLEKKMKKHVRKNEQLPTNHLQYFPHMNCYPNDMLSHSLSLNMASTFWNEVKNLMHKKNYKDSQCQKKKYAPKVSKFSSKKIKFKQRLRHHNISTNVWNIDSIPSCHVPSGIVDNSATDYLEHSSDDVLSNSTNNDTEIHNSSNGKKVEEDRCCDSIMEENIENTFMSSTPKEILDPTNKQQDEESSEISLCEDMKDNISNVMEDTDSNVFNDTRCCSPTVEKTIQTDDNLFTVETLDTEDKNCLTNIINNAATATTAATTNSITVSDNIVASTSKICITNTSSIISNKCHEFENDLKPIIPYINTLSNTELKKDVLQRVDVLPNTGMSYSNDENKVNNGTTKDINSTAVTNMCPITNIVTAITTSTITATSSNITNSSITTSKSARTQKRKLQHNFEMDLSEKRNSEKVCKVKNNAICDNEKTKDDTTEQITNDKCDSSFEDYVSRKKQRIAHEVKISNNPSVAHEMKISNNPSVTHEVKISNNPSVAQEMKISNNPSVAHEMKISNNPSVAHEVKISNNEESLKPFEILNSNQPLRNVSVSQLCKAITSVVSRTNIIKTKNEASEVNVSLVPKESKSIYPKIVNPAECTLTDVNEFMQKQNNCESVKTSHGNLKSKFKCTSNKSPYNRLMDNIKNLRTRPPLKINDLELFSSDEPIITETNQSDDESKSTSQAVHNENIEVKNNFTRDTSDINGTERYKPQSKSIDTNIQEANETSQQENVCIEMHETSKEKHSTDVCTKEESALDRIISEMDKFSHTDGVNKNKKVHSEVTKSTTDMMCNKNNVHNQSHNAKIVTLKNTENLNNNISISSEIITPTMLLAKHFNKNPKSLRTSKKALNEMVLLSRTTDNFVKKQIGRITSNIDWNMTMQSDVVNKLSSTCTARIVAKGVVEFMLERSTSSQLDKTFTPPAPLMTMAHQRITSLLIDLEMKLPSVVKLVQAGIEFKIFRLTKTPMLHQIQNLTRLYVVLTRIQKDRERARMLCCDALYCLGLHAVPVIYTVLTCWPEVLPQFSEDTDKLPICMAHIIVSLQAKDFPQLSSLKSLLTSYYQFKSGDHITKNLMDDLLNSLADNNSSIGINGLKTAIILLAKKEGTSWTYTNVIQGNLLPKIVNRKYSSMYEAFCLLGHLLRTFPKDDNKVKNIIEQLSDLIVSGEGSEDQQEGIISALLSLSRHNFEKVAESVIKWTPTKPLRTATMDQLAALFKCRSLMHWKSLMKKNNI